MWRVVDSLETEIHEETRTLEVICLQEVRLDPREWEAVELVDWIMVFKLFQKNEIIGIIEIISISMDRWDVRADDSDEGEGESDEGRDSEMEEES